MKRPVSPESKTENRRKFDEAFKQEAVALWLNSGKSASVIAAELGLNNANLLYTWRKKFAPVPAGAKPRLEDLASENAALRQENGTLRRQRDILKKTLGILSEAPSNGMNGSTR